MVQLRLRGAVLGRPGPLWPCVGESRAYLAALRTPRLSSEMPVAPRGAGTQAGQRHASQQVPEVQFYLSGAAPILILGGFCFPNMNCSIILLSPQDQSKNYKYQMVQLYKIQQTHSSGRLYTQTLCIPLFVH